MTLFHFACLYNTVYNRCSNTMFWQSAKQYRNVAMLLHIDNRVNIIYKILISAIIWTTRSRYRYYLNSNQHQLHSGSVVNDSSVMIFVSATWRWCLRYQRTAATWAQQPMVVAPTLHWQYQPVMDGCKQTSYDWDKQTIYIYIPMTSRVLS